MKFCPNCGAKRRPGSRICAKCGYQFKNYKPAPAAKKSGKKKAMAIVIAVIAVCGLTFAFIKHHQDSSNPAIATSSSSQSTGNSDTDSSATPSANTSATAKLSPGESPKLDAASVRGRGPPIRLLLLVKPDPHHWFTPLIVTGRSIFTGLAVMLVPV